MKMKQSFLGKVCLLSLIVILTGAQLFAQKVTGVVVDESNTPIPGVTVVVRGTSNGIVTDSNGSYSIAPGDVNKDVLSFSFVGFETKEVEIKGQKVINVQLKVSTLEIDEVVAVGYGTLKKSDLTGAVGSLKSAEIQKSTASNALQVMQGKVAGIDITQSSGQAGSGVNINLRGNRSINASNNPLIMVDGVDYGSTLDINSSDIESMEVLKDAASTAIYGTRGANGVILITTKKGGSGKTKVNFNSYVSVNSASNIPKIMTAQNFTQKRFETLIADEENKQYSNAGIAYNATTGAVTWDQTSFPTPLAGYGTITLDKLMQNAGVTDANKLLSSDPTALQLLADGVNLDYLDMIFRNSISQNYELGITGGNEKTSINFSLGIMDDQGLLRNDNMRRYNLKLGVDHKVFNNVRVGSNVLFTNKKYNKRNSGIFNQALKTGPIGTLYNADGTYKDFPDNMWTTAQPNPMLDEVAGSNVNEITDNRLFSSAYASITFFKGLVFKSNLGVDLKFTKNGLYQGPKSLSRINLATANTEMTNTSSWSYTWDNTLTYNKTIGIHDFQAMVGSSANANSRETYYMKGIGQTTPVTEFYDWNGFASVSSVLLDKSLLPAFTASQMLSYFGRVNYKLKDKYLFQATYRTDGSSILSAGNKWQAFPSASIGWRASEEDFMKKADWLNNLKLRLSWGMAGNAAVAPYSSYTLVGGTQIYSTLDNVIYSSYAPGQAGNPDLKWETTTTTDLGFDFGILENRISGTIDLYQSQTKDLLFLVPLPTTQVYPNVMANVAESKNKGVEVYINTKNGKSGNFDWSTDWNFSMNRDEIVKLRKGSDGTDVTQLIHDVDQVWKVGESVNSYYYYEKEGLFTIEDMQSELDYIKQQTASGATIERGKIPMISNKFYPGDIKLKDLNGDGQYTDLDKVLHSRSPKFTFGISNNFSYHSNVGDFGLSVMIYSRLGQYMKYDYYGAYKSATQTVENGPYVDAWTPTNTGASFPRYSSLGNGVTEQYRNALQYVDGSFVKIKDVTLSYSLPKNILTTLQISNLKVYATAKNMFNFSKVDNYDSELGGSMNFPLAKQIIFGLNLDF